jgi:hypothetical protein
MTKIKLDDPYDRLELEGHLDTSMPNLNGDLFKGCRDFTYVVSKRDFERLQALGINQPITYGCHNKEK